MLKINKIVVCLDQSELDPELIDLSFFIASRVKAKSICFINVIRYFYVPEEVLKEFPNLIDKALENRKSELKKSVEKHVKKKTQYDIQYVVQKGQPARTILEWSEKNNIDLIIAGKKDKAQHSGVLANRLARKATCSILIVPEESVKNRDLTKLIVPIDFSKYSKLALEQAIEVSKNHTKAVEIIALNVFNVPVGYHYTGKSFQEFAKIMQHNAEKNYNHFIKTIDLNNQNVKALYELDEHEKPANMIYETSSKENASGIFIGSKGKTAATSLFLGSISERFISMDNTIPVLIVRPKGENMGILEALKHL